MTTISSTSATASSTSGTASLGGTQALAGNFDTFLTLLTTQLKNQDPTSPLDTNQFTQQLVEFSGVEQQLKTNDLLGSLVSASANTNAGTAASYLGATITADGSTATLAKGKAEWTWTADRAAAKATITIQDASGATVYTKSGSLAAGPGGFDWDGRSDDGSFLTGGTYTIKVDAQDASGQPVTVSTAITGTVDSVDLSGASPVLGIGSVEVPLSSVRTLKRVS